MKPLQDVLSHCAEEFAMSRKSPPSLMTHVVLGYPSLQSSIEIVVAMADAGAKIIELQIPFSDPMADGPTIMAANEAALRNGTTIKDCFRAAEILRRKVSVPLLFMSYFNLLYRYSTSKRKLVDVQGTENFCRDAAQCGIQGLIVPDVPPEEHEGYWDIASRQQLAPIPIVTPLSTPARLKKIQSVTTGGFIYCVTTAGTTGVREQLPPGTPPYLSRIRQSFSQPLAVGFGISNRKQIAALKGLAEIAIIGSAIVKEIEKGSVTKAPQNVARFIRGLS